VPLSVTKQY